MVGIAISGFIALVDGTTLQISPAQDALVGVGVIATVLGVVGFVGAAEFFKSSGTRVSEAVVRLPLFRCSPLVG
ncbi:hypothetical protein CXR27_15485 [Brevibacterium aurantiacum]|uniref:Uncharacterized protein n=1 Tax=Brevibacterium aurantiacum TaxID=273384 RepID=A0A3T0DSX2_BREAU|nr:hypothetical protein CXR27_15485 [Brevibacterium aurantiacum]